MYKELYLNSLSEYICKWLLIYDVNLNMYVYSSLTNSPLE